MPVPRRRKWKTLKLIAFTEPLAVARPTLAVFQKLSHLDGSVCGDDADRFTDLDQLAAGASLSESRAPVTALR